MSLESFGEDDGEQVCPVRCPDMRGLLTLGYRFEPVVACFCLRFIAKYFDVKIWHVCANLLDGQKV